jgi:PAS domain S-box-containing protein
MSQRHDNESALPSGGEPRRPSARRVESAERLPGEPPAFGQGNLPIPHWLASFLHLPQGSTSIAKQTPPTQDPGFWHFVIENVREYAIFTTDLDGHVTTWNTGAQRILGYAESEILGRKCDLIFTPEDRARGAPDHERHTALHEGRASDRRWHMRKDGGRFWGSGAMMALRDDEVRGFVKVLRDETDAKRAEEQRQLLINELNHRVKNTLATVQSIAAQTLALARVAPEVKHALEDRLLSLADAHNILTREHWEGASLHEVVDSAVAPYRSQDDAGRFDIDGEPVRVRPGMALAIALALHELATNAVKYGSLSSDQGRIAIRWRVNPDNGWLRLAWQESDGPKVTPPTSFGFGSRLLKEGLRRELRGRVSLDYEPTGVICVVDAPLHD